MVPRITLKADYGNSKSFGELSLISLGYGLHQTWIYAVMFAPMLFMGMRIEVPGAGASYVYMVSILVYGFVLITAGLFDQRLVNTLVTRRFVVASSVVMSAGTLLAVLPSAGPVGIVLESVGGVLTGIGSAGLLLEWGVQFARKDGKSIVLNTAFALCIAALLYAVVLHHVPTVVASAVVVAIPLCEMLLLFKIMPAAFFERGDAPAFVPFPLEKPHFLAVFGIPVAAFGFGLAMLRQTSMSEVVPAMSPETQIAVVVAAACAALLIMITAVALGGMKSWKHYFRIIIPVVAVSALFVPSSLSGSLDLSGCVLVMGYLCFEGVIWSFFGELSGRFRLSPVFVFGIGRGILAIVAFFGAFSPIVLDPFFNALSLNELGSTVVVMSVIAIAYALLPDEREMERLIAPCPLLLAEFDEGALRVGVHGQKGIAGAGPAKTGVAASVPLTPEVRVSGFPEPTSEAHPSGEGEADILSAGGSSAGASKGASDSSRETADRPSKAGAAADDRRRGWFKANCDAIAERYLLSRREAEVLELLAKGYNSAYIQEKLYISEGTVKTHVRHIYRKLDVHSQQDLMRMVEEADK